MDCKKQGSSMIYEKAAAVIIIMLGIYTNIYQEEAPEELRG